MTPTRRRFLETVSATAVYVSIPSPSRRRSVDDPLGVRRDFPVVDEGVYLDGAYITPSPRQAISAVRTFIEAKARTPVSLGRMLQETDAVRAKFARLINASQAETGMLFATSDGENIVARALDLGPGDNVVVDDLHYETTYLLYQHLAESRGLEVRIVESDGGRASVDAFAQQVASRTRMVSVAWVSHRNGYRHDLRGLAELAHAHGAYLYSDAIQGIGAVDLDVRDVGIDFLTAGTYKWLLGGFGVAPFYVREGLLDLVQPDRFGSLQVAEELGDHQYTIHEDGRKYGYATLSFGAVYQLGAALDYLLAVGVPNIERHTVGLAHRLRDGLAAQGYEVWTPEANRSPIVAFDHGRDISGVRSGLEAAGVKVSLKEQDAQIRAGVALFNNTDDIDALLAVTGSWAE